MITGRYWVSFKWSLIEGFHEPVLPRAGRFDIDSPDLLIGQPLLEFLGDELRTVVGADILRGAVLLDGFFHQSDHVSGFQGPVGPQDVALAGILVEHRQHSQSAATHGGIRDEVPSPDVPAVRRLGRQPGRVAAPHQLAFGRWHPEAFDPS